jgi:glycosyltransferase involved in cell wall biosynthesis
MNVPPLVSVRLATYNQERYLAQCLESILMQRTTFPFEVVIGEDCSTDRTGDIARAYAEKYPDQLRLLPSEKNLGPALNNQRIQQACRGTYHAMIEGDDYWIDPLKLQKQVDFMAAHPQVTLCFHNVFIVDETQANARLYVTMALPETLTFADITHTATPTVSHLARSEVLATLPEWRLKLWSGDLLFRLWCAHHGAVGYLSDIMAVYRKHAGGLTAKVLAQPRQRFSGTLFLYEQFDRETGYQHTALIQPLIAQEKAKFQRQRLGGFYFLRHPGQAIDRLKQYAAAINRYRHDF